MNNTKGSIWRKWDLHVHTPASYEWTGSRDYREIIKKINRSDIKVFAITDYWTFGGYKELININEQLVEEERLKKSIFPGIELRFDILTDTNPKQRVNFQVVLNNDGTKEEVFDRVDQFYNKIKLSSTDRVISEQSFIDIAKDYSDDVLTTFVGKKRSECKDKDYLLAGHKSCFVSYECLRKILKDNDLSEELIIIAPWDKYGGISKIDSILRNDQKKKLTKLAACVESSKKETRKLFLLDKNTLATKKWAKSWKQFLDNKQKPCICGSDAHRIGEYGKSYCWIKSDMTFEGLKQIIYEPGERVIIQDDNPYSDKEKVYFSYLKIEGSKNYVVPDIKIPLNRELITIIGGRGSGKSALLESIAFLNEEHVKVDPNGKKKIIEYYRANEDNKEPPPNFTSSVQFIDKDGKKESYSKSLDKTEVLGLPFLYIGQEQLSILATNEKELTKKVCELINIDFSELEQNNLREGARDILTATDNLNAEIHDLYEKYPEYKGGDFDVWITQYIKQKESQKKKLSSKKTRKLLEEISLSIDRGLKLKDYRLEVEKLLTSFKEIIINKQIRELNKLEKSLYGGKAVLLPSLDIKTQKAAITKKINKIDKEMSFLRKTIIEKRKKLAKSGLKEDVSVLLQATELIQKKISKAVKDGAIYREKNKLLISLIKSRNQLYIDIRKRLLELKNSIDEKFIEFKKSRDGSSEDEKKLFSRVIKGVDIEGIIAFDQESFCKYMLENCLDKRSVKTEENLKALIAKRDDRGQAKNITLDSLKTWVENDLDTFLKSDMFNVRGIKNLIDHLFINWDEFITVRTIVKLNGVSTEKLSVGQRGTLLLKIYLSTATAKQIFIVDQPEDNLDNSFIMHELVPLIRRIKKSRQIIMSTHNANLVVNADSEQVLVAKLDENKGDYIGGSIENPIINKNIKDILEGGEDAFRSRENKYGMKSLHLRK